MVKAMSSFLADEIGRPEVLELEGCLDMEGRHWSYRDSQIGREMDDQTGRDFPTRGGSVELDCWRGGRTGRLVTGCGDAHTIW
jgi:hypothetical protein